MNAKQAARAAKKNAARKAALEQQWKDHNLIPQRDVAKIKELLSKETRTEDEWTMIKDILASHRLIVISFVGNDPQIKECNHMLVDENRLIAFTNMNDTEVYVKEFLKRNCPEGRYFQLGSLPFEEAVETADREKLDLYIDHPFDDNIRFMYYSQGRIKAAVLMKP